MHSISVAGLEQGSHSLVFGQVADDCGESGISVSPNDAGVSVSLTLYSIAA